ncbi:MAG: DUF488 family protein [Chloroflexi bacterium]|nr:DUF488 family protein [Chloroflexota bacterium]
MPEIDFGLYTIGHDGRTLPDLIALLKQHHIEFVVDVRPNPITPQPDFNQPNLIPQLQEQGLRYLFLGDSFRLKAEEPAYQYALQRLQNAYGQRRRVALLGRTAAPSSARVANTSATPLPSKTWPSGTSKKMGACNPMRL